MIEYIPQHPSWYFNKYDSIFLSKNRCAEDIITVNRLREIKGKNVQEIGAGTGNHAFEILNYKPTSLTLVDYEQEAISILKKRFFGYEHVEVEKGNGLQKKGHNKYDLILCMYSIVQQNINRNNSLDKILNLIMCSMNKNSYFLFEFIDHNVSQKLYHNESETEIHKTKNEIVKISSKYEYTHTIISYTGILSDEIINYKIKIDNLEREDISDYAKNSNTRFKIEPLDSFGRRNIACLWKA